MALNGWTITMIIAIVLVALALIISSIWSVTGAVSSFNSAYFNSSAAIRSAHSYLTIAGALGFSCLFVIIVCTLIAAFTDGFTSESATDRMLLQQKFTREDVEALAAHRKQLKSKDLGQIITFIILFIIMVVTFIVGILATIAAVDIGGMPAKDAAANTAYGDAIVASVSGITSIAIMMLLVIAYMGIRSMHTSKLNQVQDLEAELRPQLE